jgi:hypothetical protein
VRRYRFAIVVERESRDPREHAALLRRRLELLEGCRVLSVDAQPAPEPDPLRPPSPLDLRVAGA